MRESRAILAIGSAESGGRLHHRLRGGARPQHVLQLDVALLLQRLEHAGPGAIGPPLPTAVAAYFPLSYFLSFELLSVNLHSVLLSILLSRFRCPVSTSTVQFRCAVFDLRREACFLTPSERGRSCPDAGS